MKNGIALVGWTAFGAAAALASVEFGGPGLLVVVALFLLLPGRRQAAAALAGAAAVPFWVAYRNRGGPGTVCHSITNGTQCDQRLNPWPWVAVALVLVAIGVAVYRNSHPADD